MRKGEPTTEWNEAWDDLRHIMVKWAEGGREADLGFEVMSCLGRLQQARFMEQDEHIAFIQRAKEKLDYWRGYAKILKETLQAVAAAARRAKEEQPEHAELLREIVGVPIIQFYQQWYGSSPFEDAREEPDDFRSFGRLSLN